MRKFAMLSLAAVLAAIMMVGSAFAHSGSEAPVTDAPREQTKQQTQTISTQIKARTAPSPEIGGGAGDGTSPLAFWGQANAIFFDYNHDDEIYNSKSLMLTGGLDYELGDFLLGAAVSLERNIADDNNDVDYKAVGLGLIPYVAYTPWEWLVLDVMVGATALHNSLETGTGHSDDYSTKRYFASGNANGYYQLGDFILNPFVGYTYSHSRQSAIDVGTGGNWAERLKSWSGQWRIGIGSLYAASEKVDLNFGVAYLNQNIGGSSANYNAGGVRDKDEWEPYFGLNYQVKDDFKVGVDTAVTLGKQGTNAGNIGMSFEWVY